MKKPCKVCYGRGYIEKDDKLYECDCERWRRIAEGMDKFIRTAEVLDPHLVHPLVDMIGKDCYVLSSWNDARALIKVAMIKHNNRLIKITSDAIIRNVFVGGASKNARAADFEGEIYNNLQDYMDQPDLMIVRLNELSYKNRAASGALEEAIMYRLDRKKPVWVLSDIDKPFSLGSHAYSQSLAEIFNSLFQKIAVPRIIPRQVVEDMLFSATAASTDSPGVTSMSTPSSSFLAPEPASSLETSPPVRSKPKTQFRPDFESMDPVKKPMKIRSVPDDEPVNFLDMIGQGGGSKKKGFKKGLSWRDFFVVSFRSATSRKGMTHFVIGIGWSRPISNMQ